MKLIDLMLIINEGTTVTVHGTRGLQFATYDGKDGIPKQFNDFEIDSVSVDRHGALRIDVQTDVIEDGWSSAEPIENWFTTHGRSFDELAFLDFRFEAYGDSHLYVSPDGDFYYSYSSIGD